MKPVIAVLGLSMSLSAAVKIEKTAYRGWPNCYRLSNGEVELIVTTDIGPRVIRYGFAGGQNLFKEYAEQMGKSGEKTWQARGGHRVWMAPEDPVLSYALDNSPVHAEVRGDSIELTQNVEPESGLQKQMIVKLAATGTHVEVTHRITNRGSKVRDIATWALTQMAPGGTGISLFPPRGTHDKILAPTNPLVMWAYTDFSDNRWHFTKKYLTLRNDANNASPQKVGLYNSNTAGAYLLGTDLFVKQYTPGDPLKQPDFGCSYETFTNNEFLEMETLGQLTQVKSGASIQHIERWSLAKNVHFSAWTDAEIDRVLLPLLKQ
ncbi:MAG: hypothetical protein JO022_09320 [Acidobacteriaceae bacterium]|nr:hypothetical protein [Acidobacteriaceae bacterium]